MAPRAAVSELWEVMRMAEPIQEGSGLQQSLGPPFHSVSPLATGRGHREKAPTSSLYPREGETKEDIFLPEVTQQVSDCFSPPNQEDSTH